MSRRAPNRTSRGWPTPDELRRDGAFLCLDFVNSEWTDWRGEGDPTDQLGSRDWWKAFLDRWGLGAGSLTAPRGPRMTRLRKLRSIMRSSIERRRMPAASELRWLNRELATAPNRWTLQSGNTGLAYRVAPSRADWPAVTAALIISFSQLMDSANLKRLKRCANPDCSYLFYDESTNGSRRWCFSNVCGNLVHVRAFRARQT